MSVCICVHAHASDFNYWKPSLVALRGTDLIRGSCSSLWRDKINSFCPHVESELGLQTVDVEGNLSGEL